MNRIKICILILICLSHFLHGQTPGFIYRQSTSNLGKLVMDPNGDGFTSPTSSGYSGTDFGTGSELKMIAIPVLMGEPLNDLNTGGSGGHTDIANFTTTGQSTGITSDKSVFILKRTVNGIDYLILRYRVGGASTATKGYSVLFDTDGQFGTIWNGNNPGFDREVVLETGTNGRVAIYKHTINGTELLSSYNVHEHSQRSVALSNAGGDADYFYDFFIPLAALDATSPVRFAAATITSAGSGITGTVSDFNGVDDKLYGNNQLLIMQELINIFPSVLLADLDENYDPSNWKMKTIAPTVNTGLQNTAVSISGTSKEPNGTIIRVYEFVNNISDSIFIGQTTVNNGSWTFNCSGNCGLIVGDKVIARAFGINKTQSDLSNQVLVISACNFITPPTPTGTNSGQGSISYSWTSSTTIAANTVRLRVFLGQSLTELNPSTIVYISSGSTTGTATFLTGLASNTTPKYSESDFFAKVEINGCLSDFSTIQSGRSTALTQTPAPTLNTNPIFSTVSTPRTIVVTNNASAPTSTLYLFVNGIQRATSTTTIAPGGTFSFSITNLSVGDTVYARAFGPNTTHTLSGPSNKVLVTTNTLTPAPIIDGSYTQGSNRTVTGRSSSPAGTTIILFANGVQIGTAVVDAFGKWSISGLNLTSGQVLTSTATEPGKLQSPVSNSVTVLPPPPTAPVITTTNVLANNTTSISGTISGNTDSIVIYIDGIRIGVAIPSGGSWTLNGINPFDLYKGSQITAVNYYQGSPSAPSNIVIAVAPDKFMIKDANGNNLGTQTAGVDFDIDVTAQYSNNTTFTQYNDKNMFSSPSTMNTGSGPSSNFSNGFLNNHTINLTKAGTFTLNTMSQNDPSITGSTSVTVNPAAPSKLTLIIPCSKTSNPGQTFPTQPTVAITDAYGNVISNDNLSGSVTVTIDSENGSNTITAILSGTTTVNFPTTGQAQHTFSGFSINKNGTYVLKFTPTKSGINPVYDTVVVRSTKIWYGYVSTDFNTPNNWISSATGGQASDIPGLGDNVQFHTAPGNPCLLDQPRTLGSIIIASNVDANKSYFDINGQILTLQGNFTLSNFGKIKADGNASRLVMAGNLGTSQILPKDRFINDRIYALELNNSNGILMDGDNYHLRISHMMTFNRGVLNTQENTNCIMFEDNVTQPSGSNTSYIEGKCAKVGNDAFLFPIGRAGKYAPCEISAPSQVTDMFCTEYFPASHHKNNKKNQNSTYGKSLSKKSTKEYWNIDRKVGTSTVDVALHWYDASFSEIINTNVLTVAHFDSINDLWEIPSTNSAIVPTVNSFNANSGKVTFPQVSTFSPFTFGETNPVVGLPVELVQFQADCHSDFVQIKWTTASEKNNEFFELYKSEDAVNWEKIYIAKGQGTKATETHYTFNDVEKTSGYYRLKDVDMNGKESWSKIIAATCKDYISQTIIYPNPANDYFVIETVLGDDVTYSIKDAKGMKIMSESIITEKTKIDISSLSAGIYFVEVSRNATKERFKLIKK